MLCALLIPLIMMLAACDSSQSPCSLNRDPVELELFCGEKIVLQIAANVFSATSLLC